jgi:hypothetical protein
MPPSVRREGGKGNVQKLGKGREQIVGAVTRELIPGNRNINRKTKI